jgi:hypothetical protein
MTDDLGCPVDDCTCGCDECEPRINESQTIVEVTNAIATDEEREKAAAHWATLTEEEKEIVRAEVEFDLL